MGLCRKGHGAFPPERRQCPTCKSAWRKSNDPDRGRRINEKRAEARAQAYRFGRIAPSSKPVSLTDKVARRLRGDGPCPRCGAPSAFGACLMCCR
jgi:hypothetical protein